MRTSVKQQQLTHSVCEEGKVQGDVQHRYLVEVGVKVSGDDVHGVRLVSQGQRESMVSSTSEECVDGVLDAARDFYAKYEPKEILGKGLSSVVRRCVHKTTGVHYAVKIMDVSQSDQSLVDDDGLDLREQIRREVNILRRVSGHSNIVSLMDVFESATFFFLVFELCPNGELFDYLTSKIRLSEKRVRSIMKQILNAVLHCHNMNIVHRDLKPENVLLDDNLNVKLTDFGFAKVLQSNQRLYEVCGTPGYLAPELLKAGMLERDECNGYGFEVDSWACGVIMYTLLVGCPPFWHRKQLTMIRLIMEARYTFAAPDWDDVTDEAKDLIAKFLVAEPQQRITIADALKHPVFCRPMINRQESDAATLQLDQEVTAPLTVTFEARRKLKMALTCVRFLVRFQRLRFTPEPLSLKMAQINPYALRMIRKSIEKSAFSVYQHWVKRAEGQSRGALYEHVPRKDLVNRLKNNAQKVNQGAEH